MVLAILLVLVVFFISPSRALASILLNEIMANPNTGEPEWVELYNSTSQPISLDGWKITDNNNSSTDDLNLNGQIDPLSFRVFENTRSWLNNDGDIVSLYSSNPSPVDQYSYDKTTKGKTFGRQPDGGIWAENLTHTKGSTNGEGSSLAPTATATLTPSPTPSSTSTPIPTATKKLTPTSTKTTTPTTTPTPSLTKDYSKSIITLRENTNDDMQSSNASIAGAESKDISTDSAETEVVRKEEPVNYPIIVGAVLVLSGLASVILIYLRSRKI